MKGDKFVSPNDHALFYVISSQCSTTFLAILRRIPTTFQRSSKPCLKARQTFLNIPFSRNSKDHWIYCWRLLIIHQHEQIYVQIWDKNDRKVISSRLGYLFDHYFATTLYTTECCVINNNYYLCSALAVLGNIHCLLWAYLTFQKLVGLCVLWLAKYIGTVLLISVMRQKLGVTQHFILHSGISKFNIRIDLDLNLSLAIIVNNKCYERASFGDIFL